MPPGAAANSRARKSLATCPAACASSTPGAGLAFAATRARVLAVRATGTRVFVAVLVVDVDGVDDGIDDGVDDGVVALAEEDGLVDAVLVGAGVFVAVFVAVGVGVLDAVADAELDGVSDELGLGFAGSAKAWGATRAAANRPIAASEPRRAVFAPRRAISVDTGSLPERFVTVVPNHTQGCRPGSAPRSSTVVMEPLASLGHSDFPLAGLRLRVSAGLSPASPAGCVCCRLTATRSLYRAGAGLRLSRSVYGVVTGRLSRSEAPEPRSPASLRKNGGSLGPAH